MKGSAVFKILAESENRQRIYYNQDTNVDCVTNKGYDSWNDKIVHGERLGREILLGLAGCRVVNAWFLCMSNLGCWALTDFVKFRV